MANYGMLGLLEGVGKGMQGVGDTIKRNALLEAQAQRDLNLFNIKQRAAQGEWNRQHEISRGEQLEDREWATQREDKLYEQGRADKLDDRQWEVENRRPSAFSEKVAFYDQKLKNEEITQEQYNTALGLSSGGIAGLSAKDRLKMVNDLRSDYAKAMEVVPAEKRQPFEAWAAQNQPETWAALGGQAPGSTGSSAPTNKQIDQLYTKLIKEDPSTWNSELIQLRNEGFVQAFEILRERLQRDRRKLNKIEDGHYGQEKYKKQRANLNNKREGMKQNGLGFGLLEDSSLSPISGPVSTMH